MLYISALSQNRSNFLHEKIPQTHQFVRLWYFFVQFYGERLEAVAYTCHNGVVRASVVAPEVEWLNIFAVYADYKFVDD
jgi:hypothetical protein